MALTISRKESWVCPVLNTSYMSEFSCEIGLRTIYRTYRPSQILMCKRRQTGSLPQQKIYSGHRTPIRCPGGCRHMICPHCRSKHVHLSRRRNVIERIILAVAFVRPFRCEDCDLRFFRHSLVPFRPGHQQRRNPVVRLLPLPFRRIMRQCKETVPHWTGALRSRMASFLIAWGKN